VGNRLTALNTPYTYNSSNEMLTLQGTSYTYDANGNTFTKTNSTGTTYYAWDYENRLTSATLPGTGGTLYFTYDPFGRRIEKISPTAGTTIYTYDGDNEVSQLTATGGPQVRFTQGLGIDEPLVEQRPARTVFTEADGVGTVTSHTDPNGNLVDTFTFDSFGRVDAGFDPATDWYLYTGREIDTETALYYYRARYYDPEAGRFLSEDPIEFVDSGTNFYAYVHNNPTDLIDPLGLKVTIAIGDRTYSSTGNSVAGTITVTSDQTTDTFSGYPMENAHAGDEGNKPPIPAGTYDAFVRTDHRPNRIELENVPGYHNIQIHNGSYPRNFKGCIGAGTSHSTDFLGGTVNAINQINSIIKADGTGDITVIVGPIQ